MAPDGAPWSAPRSRIDNTLIKALARAHRWKKMLDEGRYGSVSALAAGEELDRGYLGKIPMLTLLAPDIVEAILDGRQPAELGVHVVREGFPVEWGKQRIALAQCHSHGHNFNHSRRAMAATITHHHRAALPSCGRTAPKV